MLETDVHARIGEIAWRRRHRSRGGGDVVADAANGFISAQCKGGIINTQHPRQVSRLYECLCEPVGMLMATPSLGWQVAVVPLTDATRRLPKRLAPRCAMVGIEIAPRGFSITSRGWGQVC